jgi:hypothetical protein
MQRPLPLRIDVAIPEYMSQVPTWFERKFDFSFPFELLPNLLTRLRALRPGWKKSSVAWLATFW